MHLKTINTMGTGYSGSSALYEFFQKTNLFYDPFPESNFSLTYDPGGLVDLEVLIKSSFTINKSKIAHERFVDLIEYYSKEKKRFDLGKNLSRHNPNLKNLLLNFLNNITILKYKGDTGYSQFKSNFFEKIRIKILLKLNNLQKKKMKNQNELYLFCDYDHFQEEIKKLFFELFEKENVKKKDIILDQAGSIFNPKESTKFFSNPYNICVLRDPRDIYTELKRKGYGYPGYDVETFCNWYKLIMKKIDYTENEKLIFINFEDFALKKNLILKKIFDFLKIEFSNYNDVKFDFKRPENNVQQYKDGLEKIELEYIENKLTNYLFKF